MVFSNPFGSVWAVHGNAKKSIKKVEEILFKYASNQDRITENIEIDARNKNISVLKLQFVPFPDSLNFAVRDAFRDLRSALDQACYATALAKHNKHYNHSTHFPFSKTKEEFTAASKRQRKVPIEILRIAEAFKPYGDEDGNKLLYSINDIRNAQDHRLLGHMSASLSSFESSTNIGTDTFISLMDAGVKEVASFETNIIFPPIWDNEKSELSVMWWDNRVINDVEFSTDAYICLNHKGFFMHKPPLEMLYAGATLVEQILKAIEAKSKEMGLF